MRRGRATAPFLRIYFEIEAKIMVDRVIATPATLELIKQLQAEYGELMFHQSGGCCDNSAANCYLPTDLTIGPYDVHLGDIGGVPFYISASQYEYWKHTQLIIDVIDGHGGTFSLEGNTGKAFHTRSRLFSDPEWAALQAAGLV
jgi:uncharacterized protein (DUF779 family)